MQNNLKNLMSPVQTLTAGTWFALLCLVILCLVTTPAMAAGPVKPIVVSGTPVQLGALTGGGWDGSQEPVGGTFVIGVNGNVLIGDGYTSNFLQITPSGTDTVLAAGVGASNAALDSYGNVYFGGNYNPNVYKIPYNAATGQYAGWTTAPTGNCLGGNQDTAACVFAPAVSALLNSIAGSGAAGYAGLAFDAQGNFFFETNTLPGTNPNAIYECNVACIASASATPKLIYADTQPIGAFEIDPWGNLFFVDGNNSKGKATNLNEIALSSGSYASTATVLESYTNGVGYGNGISGLAIAGNGTVYFTTNADGIFAIPNTESGGPNVSGIYMVATQGGKGLSIDASGNLYGIPYNGGDVVSYIPVGSVWLGGEPVGTAATAVSGTLIDNGGACTPALALSVTEFGAATSEFSATAGSSCSTTYSGSNGTFTSGPVTAAAFSSFAFTANFTPTAAGERTAAVVMKDSANNAGGTAVLTGVGQGAWGSLDPGVSTAFSTGFTSPAAVVGDLAGDVFVADSGAGAVYEIAQGTTTLTSIGSGLVTPDALAFDANGDLFIADDGLPGVVEIVNKGTTGAFAAGTQLTAIGTSTVFEGMALGSATGLTVGPNGTLYISDPANKRVVFWDLVTGQAGVTLATTANNITSPMGLAVDSSNNLYVADSTLDQVLVFWSAGGISEITPPNVTKAVGVAVDASGSVLVADAVTGNVVRIPDLAGTLTTANAITVETVSPSASSLWLDSMGNAYVASSSGKAAYAIQRIAGSVNLGTVQDGVTNSTTVYLMNSGNAAATLGTPVVTQPSNTMFTLEPAATNGCSSGSTGPVGASCQFTATFAPPVGTDNGLQSGVATVNIVTPAVAFSVNMAGTATQSSILAQKITDFNPPTSLEAGQQTTLSATGGDSGNPVVFSVDASSACFACATISGSTLTAVSAGGVTIDANQAGGTADGKQYAAAPQVQATITINNNLVGTGVPELLMNQQNWLAALPGGGVFAQDSAAGTSFGVNPQGNVLMGTSYGDTVDLFNVQTAAWTKLGTYGKYNNTGGVAVDPAGNLYIGALYSNIIAMVPYNNGAYSAVTDASSGTPPANCSSSSTGECVVAPVAATAGIGGVSAMTFDSAGDLFIGTDDQGNNPWSIWECTAACLATGSPAPVMLYQEPAGNNSSTTVGQYYTGGLATDPWGNLFFTDSLLLDQSTNASKSVSSDLYYLPTSTGAGFGGVTTGYAAAPTLLQTFADKTPGGYDDVLDAVAVGSDGTVYYSTQYDGIFAFPNTQSGGPMIADQYVVWNTGAKDMELDAHGNIFYAAYYGGDGGDTLGEIMTTNNLVTPNAQYKGAPVTAAANIVDNAFGCGTAATLAIASSNPEFAAVAGTTCSTIGVGSGNGTLTTPIASASSYSATITFTATQPNGQNATLSLSDTTNGGVGTAMVSGYALTTPQALVFTAPTTTTSTYAPGETILVSVTNGGSNNPAAFTVDSSSTGAGTFSTTTVTGTTSTATLTVTQAGSIVIDANEAGGLASGTYYDAAPQVQLSLTISPAAQTIVFPQPLSPVTYAANPSTTVTLSANGGDSGNAVVFTVDASSTGAGTISASTLSNGTSTATLTVSQAGNIVVDANQLATVDYSAATQVQQTIVVNQATQSIMFIPLTQPFHDIASGVTLTIMATGGGSNSAIVFTVDKSSTMTGTFSTSTVSGATSMTTLTIPAQSNTSGTIVVDATQPGNTNYSAATQTQETINVLAPLPTQTITFAVPQTQVGGTTMTLAATASSGFPITYTSSTTSVCTVSGSTATFASVTSASTCTITASQPGDNQYFAAAAPVTVSFTVNPPGATPAMNLNLSLSSLTLEPGTVGLTQISVVSQNNFTGSVTFACSGMPTGYTCTFNPSTISVAEGGTTSTALSVSASTTAALQRNKLPLVPAATLAVAFCLIGFKKRNRLQVLLLLVVSFAAMGVFTACGGSSTNSTTKPTTTNATVTATSGSITQSATLTITVD